MKKILIVEDDSSIRQLLGIRLQFNGYAIMEAPNGIEAFVKAKDERPDLIILDVSMPIMDGYQFMREIKWRDEFKNIPVVVLTAREGTREMFNEIGASDFLTKPFEADHLLQIVEQNI